MLEDGSREDFGATSIRYPLSGVVEKPTSRVGVSRPHVSHCPSYQLMAHRT